MNDNADRRIQLRESIHQLVVKAANARCVTPAALVSMVMYDYLRERGELTVVTQVSTTPPLHPKPSTTYVEEAETIMVDGEEYYADSVPSKKPARQVDLATAVAAWPDDDDED